MVIINNTTINQFNEQQWNNYINNITTCECYKGIQTIQQPTEQGTNTIAFIP